MSFARKIFVGLGLLALAGAASAQTNPLAKGPNPTALSIQRDGPFSVNTVNVSRLSASGFGGATVYYPTAAGNYALVIFCPGFTALQSSIAALGERLATHGFVVATIDTNTTLDLPESRAVQITAALRQVAGLNSSNAQLRGKIDTSRLVVTGHSMGGGGSLIASRGASFRASVPLAPYSATTLNFSSVRVPTFIIGADLDIVAPVAIHSVPFYNSLPAGAKAYAQLTAEDHLFPNELTPNQPTSQYQIAWIKRFADNDTRYSQFLNQTLGVSLFLRSGSL